MKASTDFRNEAGPLTVRQPVPSLPLTTSSSAFWRSGPFIVARPSIWPPPRRTASNHLSFRRTDTAPRAVPKIESRRSNHGPMIGSGILDGAAENAARWKTSGSGLRVANSIVSVAPETTMFLGAVIIQARARIGAEPLALGAIVVPLMISCMRRATK